jgi:putative chitinase
MILTQEKLAKILTKNKNVGPLFETLSKLLPKYEINTVNRIAGFLAQCGHESADFTVLKENLNYGAKGLRATFPKYFTTDAIATLYERQPEKIANRVYASRMGNGAEASGEGYRYRGRGAIQLTGKDNYSLFAKSIGKTLDDTVGYCETLDGAIESACWYWKKNNLNATCDANDIVAMTKKINGGTIGLDERKSHYEKAKGILT